MTALQLCSLLLGLGLPVVAPQGRTPLTAAQLAKVERGEHVVITENQATSPWPAVRVYAYIQSSPQKAAAVFTDYDSHSTYIPGLTKSEVSKRIDEFTAEVDYTLEVPVVRDEDYTVRNHIARDSAGVTRVDWILVRATSTKATVGYARFSPHVNSRTGKSGTLLEYYNFVTPGSRLAGLGFIRNRAMTQVQETVQAIVRRIETGR